MKKEIKNLTAIKELKRKTIFHKYKRVFNIKKSNGKTKKKVISKKKPNDKEKPNTKKKIILND
jgi:uncharacterized membrane protein